MRITFDCPDGWLPRIKEAAQADGHDSTSAVCRKAVAIFLDIKSRKVDNSTTELDKNKNEHDTDTQY